LPENIEEALKKTLYKNKKIDFDPADAYMALVAFGLSTTGRVYAGTEWPIAEPRRPAGRNLQHPYLSQAFEP
jgi:hypothetical protein